MIDYNEYELLEFFGAEPRIIGEEEVGIYEYNLIDKYGFAFELHFSLYDESCILTLQYDSLKVPIFDLRFDYVEKIQCDTEKLIIHRTANQRNIVFYVKPNYALAFEECLL